LESVIKSAGYHVGRITALADFDPRESVLVDGVQASVPDFVKAANEIKRAAAHCETEPCREEAVFALGLLLCRLRDCDFVILQGTSGEQYSLDAVCAPYDLIVLPTVYRAENAQEQVKPLCEAVRRGTREVVSGNQKSEVYNVISNACAMVGVRLYIPMKAQLSVARIAPRKLEFGYGDREGYAVKSPSYVIRDAAITVIESALALRRGGVKMPWSSISDGLAAAGCCGCFDLISVSPVIISDTAANREEVELLLKTAEETLGDGDSVSVCLLLDRDERLDDLLAPFERSRLRRVIAVSSSEPADADPSVIYCDDVRRAAELIMEGMSGEGDGRVFCFGGVRFAETIKKEIVSILNKT
jgi:folylpolyglutamate synthase/dihydropteroate synthase